MATNNPNPKRLIALDFDGVLVDSVGESSLSALEAARRLWGDSIIPPDADLERSGKHQPLLRDMAYVRPCVETGYENIVQIRLLLEGMDADYLLRNWRGEVLPRAMAEWGLDREALVALFGRVRDEWIARDLEGWLAPNATYGEEVGDAVRACLQRGDEVFVVTTKQAQFTAALLKGLAGLPELAGGEKEEEKKQEEKPPGEGGYARIISTTLSGRPKVAVLEELRAAHAGPDTRCVFVEDKLSTLETTEKRFLQQGEKNPWEMLLVDWGYNTEEERERARRLGIKVVGREAFGRALEGF
jgi:phosphoglycolate phosphatase-like HAD superfamily hydrolase